MPLPCKDSILEKADRYPVPSDTTRDVHREVNEGVLKDGAAPKVPTPTANGSGGASSTSGVKLTDPSP